MKMAFLAVFRSATFGATIRACSRLGLIRSAKYDATMPVPAICRKRRRENPGPSESPLDLSQVGHSIFDFGSVGLRMIFLSRFAFRGSRFAAWFASLPCES